MFTVEAHRASTVKLNKAVMKTFGSHLFYGGNCDDKEKRQSTGDGARGSVDDQLK